MKIPGFDFLVFQSVHLLHGFGRIKTVRTIESIQPASVRSILIVVTTALGDSITFTPALDPIRRRFPHARIVGFYHHAFADLYADDPRFDRIIPYYGKYKRLRKTIRALREESCDLALLPYMNDPDVIPLILLGGSRALFRMPGRNTIYSFCVMNSELLSSVPPPDHANRRAADMAAYLGCNIPTLESSLHLDSDAQIRMDRLLEDIRRRAKHPDEIWIGFHPGASIPQKCWPVDHFRTLAGQALEKWPNAHILLSGSAGEWDLCENIRTVSRDGRITNLAGDISIHDMPALLKRLAVLVSGDTGIAVMAYAVACRTVTLFWSTDPARSGPGIAGDIHRVVAGQSADSIWPDRIMAEIAEQIQAAAETD